MLAGVAGKDHTALVGQYESQKLVHLPTADLSRFIDQHHAPGEACHCEREMR